jgi:hypothetical protein
LALLIGGEPSELILAAYWVIDAAMVAARPARDHSSVSSNILSGMKDSPPSQKGYGFLGCDVIAEATGADIAYRE